MTRVLIVDDRPSLRTGLRALVDAEPDLDVCGTAARGQTAVLLAGHLRPDVVLMDLSMPGMDGILTTMALLRTCPGTRVLVLTGHADQERVDAAVAAGACGYVLKTEAPDRLLASVREVAAGGRPFSEVLPTS